MSRACASWVRAWLCNLARLARDGRLLVLPAGELGALIRASYMGLKAAFVLLLIQGAWALKRPGAGSPRRGYLALGVLVYAAICAALPLVIEQVGVVQHTAMGVAARGGAGRARRREAGLGWLAGALPPRRARARGSRRPTRTSSLPAGTIEPATVGRPRPFSPRIPRSTAASSGCWRSAA